MSQHFLLLSALLLLLVPLHFLAAAPVNYYYPDDFLLKEEFYLNQTIFFKNYYNQNSNRTYKGVLQSVIFGNLEQGGIFERITQTYDICYDEVYFGALWFNQTCLDFCDTEYVPIKTTDDPEFTGFVTLRYIMYNYCLLCNYPEKELYMKRFSTCKMHCDSKSVCNYGDFVSGQLAKDENGTAVVPYGLCLYSAPTVQYCDCSSLDDYQLSMKPLNYQQTTCSAFYLVSVPLVKVVLNRYVILALCILLLIIAAFLLAADLIVKFYIYYDLRTWSTLFLFISLILNCFSKIASITITLETAIPALVTSLFTAAAVFLGLSYSAVILLFTHISAAPGSSDATTDESSVNRGSNGKDLSLQLKIVFVVVLAAYVLILIFCIAASDTPTLYLFSQTMGVALFVIINVILTVGILVLGIKVTIAIGCCYKIEKPANSDNNSSSINGDNDSEAGTPLPAEQQLALEKQKQKEYLLEQREQRNVNIKLGIFMLTSAALFLSWNVLLGLYAYQAYAGAYAFNSIAFSITLVLLVDIWYLFIAVAQVFLLSNRKLLMKGICPCLVKNQ